MHRKGENISRKVTKTQFSLAGSQDIRSIDKNQSYFNGIFLKNEQSKPVTSRKTIDSTSCQT